MNRAFQGEVWPEWSNARELEECILCEGEDEACAGVLRIKGDAKVTDNCRGFDRVENEVGHGFWPSYDYFRFVTVRFQEMNGHPELCSGCE